MSIVSEAIKSTGIGLRIVNGTNPFNSDYVSDDPIHINCCGYNLFDPGVKRVEIYRPMGRMDYQMIYIQEGRGDFLISGRNVVLKEGTLILFRPGKPQQYSFHNDCRTVAYFIHFTGSIVKDLLDTLAPEDQMIFTLENDLFFSESVLEIYRELQLHAYNYDLMCTSIFTELVCKISRSINSSRSMVGEEISNTFTPALNMMNNQYMKDLPVDEYARLCGVSTYYFIRKFKEHTGFSPHAYLIKVRMERAKDLLITTNMNISEISFAVGYDNPLYFSRMFKKHTGVSPASYKKQMSAQIVYVDEDEEDLYK